jgi:hypothetical protein
MGGSRGREESHLEATLRSRHFSNFPLFADLTLDYG